MLQSVANHYGFSLDTPFSDLNPEHVQVILHGGSEQIHFRYVPRDRDGFWEHWSSFEGVIPIWQENTGNHNPKNQEKRSSST